MGYVVENLYQALVGLYKSFAVMFKFLSNFYESSQHSLAEPTRENLLHVDNINYAETRTMYSLTLLMSALDGLTQHAFFLTTHLFGPETIFKKLLLFIGIFLSLCLLLV